MQSEIPEPSPLIFGGSLGRPRGLLSWWWWCQVDASTTHTLGHYRKDATRAPASGVEGGAGLIEATARPLGKVEKKEKGEKKRLRVDCRRTLIQQPGSWRSPELALRVQGALQVNKRIFWVGISGLWPARPEAVCASQSVRRTCLQSAATVEGFPTLGKLPAHKEARGARSVFSVVWLCCQTRAPATFDPSLGSWIEKKRDQN